MTNYENTQKYGNSGKMQNIHDFLISAGPFPEENLSLPKGSPLETGHLIRKRHGLFASFFENVIKTMRIHEK